MTERIKFKHSSHQPCDHIFFAPDFLSDLFELYQYVVLSDGKQRARDLVNSLEKAAHQLQTFHDPGHQLPELAAMGSQNIHTRSQKPEGLL